MPGPGVPFKPGQSGNLEGRPRGSRHRLSERVLADLTADFEDHPEPKSSPAGPAARGERSLFFHCCFSGPGIVGGLLISPVLACC